MSKQKETFKQIQVLKDTYDIIKKQTKKPHVVSS